MKEKKKGKNKTMIFQIGITFVISLLALKLPQIVAQKNFYRMYK